MKTKHPIVIALDGTSASGKSTNAKLVAKALGYVYVDTGAMYRMLAWQCLKKNVDVQDARLVANACRRWKTDLCCVEKDGLRVVRLLVDSYFPEKEIRLPETAAAAGFGRDDFGCKDGAEIETGRIVCRLNRPGSPPRNRYFEDEDEDEDEQD